MSERSSVALPKGVPKRRAGSVHEAVIALFRQIVREEVEPRLPVMGTVVGNDGGGGGAQKVHVDDEDDAREDGFVRKLGQRYRAGDRVLLVPTKSGHMVVAGTVSDKQGSSENVVGNDDVEDDAIDGTKIKKNSIKGGNQGQLAGGAVETNNIKDNAVTPGKLSENYAKDDHEHSNIDGAKIKTNSIPDGALKENYAKDDHDHGGDNVTRQDLTDLEKDIHKWVSDNFAKK